MAEPGSSHVSRRSLLAAVGASSLAGCSTVEEVFGSDDRMINAYELPDIDDDEIPSPVVPASIPVAIGPSHLDSARDRVTDLLAALPTPFGPAQIPNGHIREHLTDAAGDATDRLTEARTARTDLMALQSLRDARGQARYAAAGWAVAEEGLSAPTLQREHRHTTTDARTALEGHEYVGTDPVRAAIVHAQIEITLHRATDTTVRTADEGQLLTVAEWGEAAESAQAHLDDARHLDEQFTGSLPADAGSIETTLTEAAETLLGDVRSRRSSLPPEPTAEEWGLEEHLLADIRQEADDGPTRVTEATGPASAVLAGTDHLAKLRALDRVQKRIDAGEITGVDSAEDVRAARETVYDALDTALAESRSPDLARSVISNLSWRVTNADRELARARGEVSPGQLDDIVAEYLLVTAVARATPASCRQTIEAFDQ